MQNWYRWNGKHKTQEHGYSVVGILSGGGTGP